MKNIVPSWLHVAPWVHTREQNLMPATHNVTVTILYSNYEGAFALGK